MKISPSGPNARELGPDKPDITTEEEPRIGSYLRMSLSGVVWVRYKSWSGPSTILPTLPIFESTVVSPEPSLLKRTKSWLLYSATNSLPALSQARPDGLFTAET